MKKDLSLLSDDEITEVFRDAVKNAIERNQKAGNPVCGFDTVLKKSYILYPDGTKEYTQELEYWYMYYMKICDKL